MFKRIDHVEITTGDIEKTIAFYIDILGFKVKERNKMNFPPLEEITYLTLNDTMVELLGIKDPTPASMDPWQVRYQIIALEVEDMEKAVEYLKTKGVEISEEPMTLGTSKRAEIKDPNGLSIELRQWG